MSSQYADSGRLLMWGYSYGKIRFVPEVIPMWEIYKVKDLKFGDQHVLVLVETIKQGQKTTLLLSWGKSSYGALGYGVGFHSNNETSNNNRYIQEGEKKATQGKQLSFFDDKNPQRITTGHTSSMVLLGLAIIKGTQSQR